MTVIATVNIAGVLGPATPIPAGALEVVAGATQYVYVGEEDFHSASPPVTPKATITNVFSGSVRRGVANVGFSYAKFPLEGAAMGLRGSVVRTHDYGIGTAGNWRARWNNIETSPGVFSWGPLDQMVDYHQGEGRDILHTLFGCPSFYSARPTEECGYENGAAAEPSDLAKWDAYVTACVTRYAGRIKYYEIWNEPNLPRHSTIPLGILSQMCRRAKSIISAIDPAAKITSPPVTDWATTGTQAYVETLLNTSDGAGGKMSDHCDIIGIHPYTNWTYNRGGTSDPITKTRAAMVALGINSKPLWCTEYTILAPEFPNLTAAQRRDGIRRLMTQALCHNAGGCDMAIWYAIDSDAYRLTAEDVQTWNEWLGQLESGVSVINVLRDQRTCAVVNGRRYVW